MRAIAGIEPSLVAPPASYAGGEFFKDAREALIGVGLLYYNERWGGFPTLEKGESPLRVRTAIHVLVVRASSLRASYIA